MVSPSSDVSVAKAGPSRIPFDPDAPLFVASATVASGESPHGPPVPVPIMGSTDLDSGFGSYHWCIDGSCKVCQPVRLEYRDGYQLWSSRSDILR